MVSSTNYVNKLYSFLNQNHELIRPIRIVFGSASPSRQEIIKELFGLVGLSYEVCTADIDEKQIRSEVPEELVTLLGHAKADAIIKKIEDSSFNVPSTASWKRQFLITCDQVVINDRCILEKPETTAEALQFLSRYTTEHPPQTVGSVIVTDLDSKKRYLSVDEATIHLRGPIPPEHIDAMIKEGLILNCAGALKIEHDLVQPCVLRIDGGEDTVKGISQETLSRLLLMALKEGLGEGDKYK